METAVHAAHGLPWPEGLALVLCRMVAFTGTTHTCSVLAPVLVKRCFCRAHRRLPASLCKPSAVRAECARSFSPLLPHILPPPPSIAHHSTRRPHPFTPGGFRSCSNLCLSSRPLPHSACQTPYALHLGVSAAVLLSGTFLDSRAQRCVPPFCTLTSEEAEEHPSRSAAVTFLCLQACVMSLLLE